MCAAPTGIVLAASSLAIAVGHIARLFLYNLPGTGAVSKTAAVLAGSGSFTESLASAVSAAATGAGPLWWLMPLCGLGMAVGAGWLYFKVYMASKQWEQENVFFRDYDMRYGPGHKAV